jgi:phosphinothricin acetyltransferase
MLNIRQAGLQDVAAITEIYNEAVLKTSATFDTETKTIEDRKAWLANHDQMHPVLVAEMDGVVVGWLSLSRWSERKAYDETAEMSLYIKESFRNKGVGKLLTEKALREGRERGLHTLIVRISEGNDISIHLIKSFGFQTVGVMREVGRKFGRRLNVTLLQLILGE